MRTTWTLLRDHPPFRTLWAAETVSMLGDWLSFVAVSLLALTHGEGAVALATVLALHTLPHALVSPLAGLLADRVDSRTLTRAGVLGEAALTALMIPAAATGSLLTVQALVLARATLSALVYPAWSVALRALVPPAVLAQANALSAGTWSVMFTVGMALGGVVSVWGPEVAFGADALTFVAAAWLLGRLPALPRREPPAPSETRPGWRGAVALAWRDGVGALPGALRHARADAQLFAATTAKAGVSLAGAGVWLLIHLEGAWLTGVGGALGLGIGLLHALRGLGTGVGPALALAWPVRDEGPSSWGHTARLRWSQGVAVVGLAVVAVAPVPLLGLVGVFVWGLGTGANWTVSSTTIQLRSPGAWLGRLSALDGALRTATLSGAALLAAAVVDLGAPPRAVALATLGCGVGALVWSGRTPAARAYPSARTTAL